MDNEQRDETSNAGQDNHNSNNNSNNNCGNDDDDETRGAWLIGPNLLLQFDGREVTLGLIFNAFGEKEARDADLICAQSQQLEHCVGRESIVMDSPLVTFVGLPTMAASTPMTVRNGDSKYDRHAIIATHLGTIYVLTYRNNTIVDDNFSRGVNSDVVGSGIDYYYCRTKHGYNSGTPQRLRLSRAGYGPAPIALACITPQLLFVASRLGHSLLVEITPIPSSFLDMRHEEKCLLVGVVDSASDNDVKNKTTGTKTEKEKSIQQKETDAYITCADGVANNRRDAVASSVTINSSSSSALSNPTIIVENERRDVLELSSILFGDNIRDTETSASTTTTVTASPKLMETTNMKTTTLPTTVKTYHGLQMSKSAASCVNNNNNHGNDANAANSQTINIATSCPLIFRIKDRLLNIGPIRDFAMSDDVRTMCSTQPQHSVPLPRVAQQQEKWHQQHQQQQQQQMSQYPLKQIEAKTPHCDAADHKKFAMMTLSTGVVVAGAGHGADGSLAILSPKLSFCSVASCNAVPEQSVVVGAWSLYHGDVVISETHLRGAKSSVSSTTPKARHKTIVAGLPSPVSPSSPASAFAASSVGAASLHKLSLLGPISSCICSLRTNDSSGAIPHKKTARATVCASVSSSAGSTIAAPMQPNIAAPKKGRIVSLRSRDLSRDQHRRRPPVVGSSTTAVTAPLTSLTTTTITTRRTMMAASIAADVLSTATGDMSANSTTAAAIRNRKQDCIKITVHGNGSSKSVVVVGGSRGGGALSTTTRTATTTTMPANNTAASVTGKNHSTRMVQVTQRGLKISKRVVGGVAASKHSIVGDKNSACSGVIDGKNSTMQPLQDDSLEKTTTTTTNDNRENKQQRQHPQTRQKQKQQLTATNDDDISTSDSRLASTASLASTPTTTTTATTTAVAPLLESISISSSHDDHPSCSSLSSSSTHSSCEKDKEFAAADHHGNCKNNKRRHHRYVVVSTRSATIVRAVHKNGELRCVERGDGFLVRARTIAAGNVLGDAILQVHAGGARLIVHSLCVYEVVWPQKYSATHASICDPYAVVVLSDGMLCILCANIVAGSTVADVCVTCGGEQAKANITSSARGGNVSSTEQQSHFILRAILHPLDKQRKETTAAMMKPPQEKNQNKKSLHQSIVGQEDGASQRQRQQQQTRRTLCHVFSDPAHHVRNYYFTRQKTHDFGSRSSATMVPCKNKNESSHAISCQRYNRQHNDSEQRCPTTTGHNATATPARPTQRGSGAWRADIEHLERILFIGRCQQQALPDTQCGQRDTRGANGTSGADDTTNEINSSKKQMTTEMNKKAQQTETQICEAAATTTTMQTSQHKRTPSSSPTKSTNARSPGSVSNTSTLPHLYCAIIDNGYLLIYDLPDMTLLFKSDLPISILPDIIRNDDGDAATTTDTPKKYTVKNKLQSQGASGLSAPPSQSPQPLLPSSSPPSSSACSLDVVAFLVDWMSPSVAVSPFLICLLTDGSIVSYRMFANKDMAMATATAEVTKIRAAAAQKLAQPSSKIIHEPSDADCMSPGSLVFTAAFANRTNLAMGAQRVAKYAHLSKCVDVNGHYGVFVGGLASSLWISAERGGLLRAHELSTETPDDARHQQQSSHSTTKAAAATATANINNSNATAATITCVAPLCTPQCGSCLTCFDSRGMLTVRKLPPKLCTATESQGSTYLPMHPSRHNANHVASDVAMAKETGKKKTNKKKTQIATITTTTITAKARCAEHMCRSMGIGLCDFCRCTTLRVLCSGLHL